MCRSLISVVVPVYNVEKYLRRCVDSILAQTYTNLEVILVDDGSKDASPIICDEYLNIDSRVRVHHQKNGGLSAARNTGIELSHGEYIAFVDSDDFIHPQMIECLYRGASENNVMLSICGLKKVSSDDGGAGCEFDESEYKLYQAMELLNMFYEYDGRRTLVNVAWNKLYHRDLFLICKFPVGKLYEDNYTSPRLIYAAGQVCVNESPLYYYFQRSDSIMHSMDSRKAIDDRVDAFKSLNSFMMEVGDESLIRKSKEDILKVTYVIERQKSVWKNKELRVYARKLYKEAYREYISSVDSSFWRILYLLMRYAPRTCNFILRAKKLSS